MPRGTLEVILISARDLHDSDFFTKMDPDVILTYRTQEHRSSVAKGSKPNWNESFLFTVSDAVSELNLRLMDKDTITQDDFLGEVKIDLESVFAVGAIPETVYDVVKDQKYCGELKVALTFTPERDRELGLGEVERRKRHWWVERISDTILAPLYNHLFQ